MLIILGVHLLLYFKEAHSQAAAGRFLPAICDLLCLYFECFYLLRFARDFNRLLVILLFIMLYCDITIL